MEKGSQKLISSTEKFFEKVANMLDSTPDALDITQVKIYSDLAELTHRCLQIVKLSKEDGKKPAKEATSKNGSLAERMGKND